MYDIYIDIHIYIYMMFIYMIYDIHIAHSTAFSGFNKIQNQGDISFRTMEEIIFVGNNVSFQVEEER